MAEVRVLVHVKEDGTLEGRLPPHALPAGRHQAVIVVDEPRPANRPLRLANFPIHDEPWDDGISLRRQDIYGDDGR